MAHLTYEQSKSKAFTIIIILGIMTIAEVLFALLGKGYLIDGVEFSAVIMAIVMIAMSLAKAYLIVYEFMHMKYEVPGLAKSVVLPTLLLVWAVIAFFYEGNGWNKSRTKLINKYKGIDDTQIDKGIGYIDEDTYYIK